MAKRTLQEPMILLNQSEYAKHRKQRGLTGGTRAAVSYAIHDGRIHYAPGHDGLINPDSADKEWSAHTEPRPTTAMRKGADASEYEVDRARREYYESELSRLKVEERQGTLIPIDRARKLLYEAGRIVRAGHEDIVSQLAPDIASETAIEAIERILKTRLDRLEAELTSYVQQLDESLLVACNGDNPLHQEGE